MKSWRQWPWKQWGKKYLFYLALWLAFDLLLLGMGEEKPLTTIFMAAPGKALMFTFIFEIVSKPKNVGANKKDRIAGDSDNNTFSSNGNTTTE